MNLRLPLAPILPLLVCVCLPVVSSAQTPTGGQAPQISKYVREVFPDRDGSYWFGTNGGGVCRYDGKYLTYLNVEEGLGGSALRGILQDSGGAVWFATEGESAATKTAVSPTTRWRTASATTAYGA